MELTEFAERVLMGTTLEEKLMLCPKSVTDERPGKAIILPDQPGRPKELIMAPRDERAAFPGLRHLEKDEERGKLLHFLANHELLATELMALVLLKFPNAPKEFRMGVFETLKEEQAHTLMYMRRMRDCGMHFGEMPVNDYFWRMVSPMEQPIDFVTRLSLTFEQANLDFSKHYAGLFREVGDTSTANVLEKIYLDEIEHVGHGLKWFKMWKNEKLSDWDAYKGQLKFPLIPAKAKGVAPFNALGRIEAGLDADFIRQLEASEGSRGRTPTVHVFNANAEGYALAQSKGKSYTPKKAELALDRDLEMLPMTWARKDDVVLVRQLPSLEHLAYLRDAGLQQPEWVRRDQSILDRKLAGMRPWAWAPDASTLLKPYADITSDKLGAYWREPLDVTLFSKEIGRQLLHLAQPHEQCYRCETLAEVKTTVAKIGGDVLMKAPFASAGRGHRKFICQEGWVETVERWVVNTLSACDYLIVEPYFDRVLDFSSQYEVRPDGSVKHIGMTRVMNDAAGRFLGSIVHPKWSVGLDANISQWLFREAKVMEVYRYELPKILQQFTQEYGYVGPLGIDSFVYRDGDGELHLRQIVEVNVRHTMGRVALELLKANQGTAGYYQIVRKSKLTSSLETWLTACNQGIEKPSIAYGSVVLNDPKLADEFYAVWHGRKTWSEIETLLP